MEVRDEKKKKKKMYSLWFFKYKKTGKNKKNRDFFKERILKSLLNDSIAKPVGSLLHLGREREANILMTYLLK